VATGTARVRSALSPMRSRSVFPSSLSPCLSCASFMRLTQTRAGGRRSVPNPMTLHDSGSYRLRSPILSIMNRRDHINHLSQEETWLSIETPLLPRSLMSWAPLPLHKGVGFTCKIWLVMIVPDPDSVFTWPIYKIWFYSYLLNCLDYGPPGPCP
jgi:hypothetical protein